MIDGLPFRFDDEEDEYFNADSMANSNLNNSDPDLISMEDSVEEEPKYKRFSLFDPIEEAEQGLDWIGGEAFMRHTFPLIETLSDERVAALGTQATAPISIKEAMYLSSKKPRQPALPKRSFERFVDKVISGEVNINDF